MQELSNAFLSATCKYPNYDRKYLRPLVAQNAPETDKGTALTIVNCIGFSEPFFAYN